MIQNLIYFLGTIYTFKLLQAFPTKSICREFISPVGYFFKWLSKLIKILNWPTGSIFTGMLRHIVHFKSLKRWRSQVFTRWCRKIQTEFLFSKIAVFLMYSEIYIHVSPNSLHSILACVLCSKMKQYWLKFHASGQRWIRMEPRGMVQPITHNLVHQKQDGSTHTTWYTKVKVSNFCWPTWYGSANHSGSDVNKMAAPFCISTCLVFCKLWRNME